MEHEVIFVIDASDPMPLYAQMERAIRVAIATGRVKTGDRMPTVRQMAVDLRVNANTVAKVYAELERTGVLESRRGVGTFVRASTAPVVSGRDRARQLSALTDRFLIESATLGFSVNEVIADLQQKGHERGNFDG